MTAPLRRRIILCADDYGISPAVSGAIRDLLARARINATSVMMAAPSMNAAEAAALVAVASGAAIGLHLTLTAPFKPLSPAYAPLRNGAFLSLPATLARAHLRLLEPKRLAAEVARQLAAFRSAFGRPPDFVDGHHHVHLLPQVCEAVLRGAKDAAPDAWLRQCGRVALPAHRRLADRKALLLDTLSRRFCRQAREAGVATNPAFAGTYALKPRTDYRALFAAFLDRLPDGGVVMCHPGIVDAELARLDPVTHAREREYAFFLDDAFLGLLAAHGVVL